MSVGVAVFLCVMFFSVMIWGFAQTVASKFASIEAPSQYIEDVPKNFDFKKFYHRRNTLFKWIAIPLTLVLVYAIFAVHRLSFFENFFYAIFATATVALGGITFCESQGAFRSKPKLKEKEQTAEGLGTLGGKLVVSDVVGSGLPLVSYLDGQAYSATSEDRGIVIGAPGSGKTTFLMTQLIDWMESGKSFVVTDVKPEIWAALKVNGVFEQLGYTDWVFNPTDVDSHHYNIFSEVKDSSELNEILAVIIKDESAESAIFTENARRLLKAILLELGEAASLPAAKRYIDSMDDNAELLKTLKQSEKESVSSIAKDISRTAKSDNLLASIMTSLSKAFDFLDDDRIRKTISDNAEGFYLKEILVKPKQAVFLQFDQQYKNSTATLFGAMVAHTLRILQMNQQREEVFVGLDEIINCPKIPNFTETLNTIRSAKMPTFLYLQSLEGLNKVYGPHSDSLFLGSSSLKICFKMNDLHTATYFSELVGKTDARYFSYSNGETSNKSQQGYMQVHGTGQMNSNSVSAGVENIIEPSELTQLEPHTALVTYNGGFGTLPMPAYHEAFELYERTPLQTMGDFKRQ